MISLPQMVMIGGNSRNCGKTTMACSIITKLASAQEVIALKVTSVRPGEDNHHGNHIEEYGEDFTIFEETEANSHKDTSKMLIAGATHVYYIRVAENCIEKALLHFLSRYINKQVIVCESRSLRRVIKPGLFLMMIRLPVEGKAKEISEYIAKADKIFSYCKDLAVIKQFAADLNFKHKKFVWNIT